MPPSNVLVRSPSATPNPPGHAARGYKVGFFIFCTRLLIFCQGKVGYCGLEHVHPPLPRVASVRMPQLELYSEVMFFLIKASPTACKDYYGKRLPFLFQIDRKSSSINQPCIYKYISIVVTFPKP